VSQFPITRLNSQVNAGRLRLSLEYLADAQPPEKTNAA